MKKFLLLILILLFLSIATLFTWRYIKYKNDPDPYKTFLLPRVEMAVVDIHSITTDKTELTLNLLIKNQFPISFTADSFRYNIYINSFEIIKSRYEKSFTLKANDSSWAAIPVTVFYHDIDSIIKSNEKKDIDSVEYSIKASFFTDFILKKEFNIEIKRKLPLIHLPKLEADHIDIDSLNFKRAALTMHASITNMNVFDIKVKDYKIEFQIEDHGWVKANIKGLTVLKAKQKTNIDFPVTISFKEMSKTIFQLLKKGKDVNYKLRINLKSGADNSMINNASIVVENSGTVKSLLKVVKGKD